MSQLSPAPVIDDDAVRAYFDSVGAAAAAASYMAHERDLPDGSVCYRMACEQLALDPWLAEIPVDADVLDLGCGTGAWAEIFADRFASVLAVDRSCAMIDVARVRLRGRANVTIVEGDARAVPPGRFGLIFLGGLAMYQSDAALVPLLAELAACLTPGGAIILRESTARSATIAANGRYQALYRSVDAYRALFRKAGFDGDRVAIRPNRGYAAMAMAGELVMARRRGLPFLPAVSPRLGALTWWALRATSPLSFGLLPWALDRLGIGWPVLQNHFFRLRA